MTATRLGAAQRGAQALATLATLAAVALASDGCGKSCTAMGCPPAATGRWTIAVGTRDLPNVSVAVCRNGRCSRGTPTVEGGGNGAQIVGDVVIRVALTGELTPSIGVHVIANLQPRSTAHDSQELSVEVTSLTRADRDALKDGDVYSVKVEWVDNRASAPLDLTKTAKYATWFPNGEDCDAEDGFFCRATTLE